MKEKIELSGKNIQEIFSEVPRTYDMVNHVLTMGLDIFWRKKAARLAAGHGGRYWLDVCSGTADTAVLLRKAADDRTVVVSQDFCMPMLLKGASKPHERRIYFCASDARNISFKDNTFDLITISFATRNINTGKDALVRHFREFNRILKPGGMFLNLETTQPRSKIVRRLFHAYVRCAVAPIGRLISGSKKAYKYLSGTIPAFFNAEELSDILHEAGFKSVKVSYLTFGACAIHTAIK